MSGQTGSSIRYDATQIVFLENGIAACPYLDVFQQGIKPGQRREFGQVETQSGGSLATRSAESWGIEAATEDHLCRDASGQIRGT